MTVLHHYQQRIAHSGTADPEQSRAIHALQRCHDELVASHNKKTLFNSIIRQSNPPKGVYIWGDVGRGKTFIMDIFFQSLPFAEKYRQHYQNFFKDIHAQLKSLEHVANPLKKIGERIAKKYRVLCIDEFHVDDITDAMILHGLIDALIAHNVVFVFTSNIPIPKLYANGLQRERFIPAIKLLEQHTESVHLNGKSDYREHLELDKERYFVGSGENAIEFMASRFTALTGERKKRPGQIELNRRPLLVESYTDNAIWIRFHELCGTPRSSTDYLELASRFTTVFLQDIPQMNEGKNDWAQRFLQLIDALYDKKTQLCATAAAEPEQLYIGKNLAFAFKRTASRLREMRSLSYSNSIPQAGAHPA